MQTATSLVFETISAEEVGDVSTVLSSLELQGFSISSRHASRLLAQVLLVEKLRRFEDIRDCEGRELNPLVVGSFDAYSRKKRLGILFGQLAKVGDQAVAVLSDRRGAIMWAHIKDHRPVNVQAGLRNARAFLGRNFALVPHGELHEVLGGVGFDPGIFVADYAHRSAPFTPSVSPTGHHRGNHGHLDSLEAESIRIIREAVAVAKKPAMLFSMGKDSMVMWALAKKSFWPEPPPFPLVVIDTQWKFQDMYRFREYIANLPGIDLMVHVNPDAIERAVNPFDFGSARHTEITKTVALKQILDEHQFDFVFGGARRDEERSRAKERVFSIRTERHGWDPKNQRPELWNLYNAVVPKGKSMRVFPLSNWTELDVWRYIEREDIPVVPLYFSKVRPFVVRDGALIMVDDERFRLNDAETILFEPIRFRTLGCYPLTGGVRSGAATVAEVVEELENSRVSERSSRIIDFDPGASMEQKKKDGYF